MSVNLFSVSEKVVVITGGYGILASEMARYLASQGAKVVILGRQKDKGQALVDEIKEHRGEALFLQSDVLSQKDLEQNRSDILDKYGRIDILINAAGGNMAGAVIPPDKNIFDLSVDDFGKVVDLNLMGTVLPTKIFVEAMVEGGSGNVINISSEAALRPLTRVIGYGAAKAAISHFTKSMAGELALKFGEKFRVNAIAPGFFITEQNRDLLTNPDGSYTDRGNAIISHTPFKRFGTPDELLGTLHYLASDASRFVTGTVLVVDGGFDVFSV